ncbi:type II secretion system minor pseudopilin GspK [Sphingorhabdus contaminans]|jgi:general secretion pathway protein K|uniref:Type II secretion system protein K n=1 Tax=Sphingorhabdus contaminans TaxID=1343899 RepID=A0A553WHX3_9SPHN|nr:type II secretion system minor pseudopilin GspK [Sphingorhabdus contaminans]TSB04297.1 general secretion pathway protein GspK [Sphingorhabdus contaminans]
MISTAPSERGAALLSVLLMVAILTVIAATTLDRLAIATKLSGNGNSLTQARMFSYAVENLASTRIEDLLARDAAQTTLEGNWLGKEQVLPVPVGAASATVRDGANCFNLNSLVSETEGRYSPNSIGQEQMVSLMVVLGINESTARPVAAAATDWVDSDSIPSTNGAEDDSYRSAVTPYRTANRLFAHPSELRAVKGVTPALYAKLRGWICALPEARLSPLNVNTLLPEQAPLLAMLFPPGQFSPVTARSYLAKRPASGYGSLIRFWGAPEMASIEASSPVQGQVKLTSTYFLLRTKVSLGELILEGESMLAATSGQVRLIWRSWGEQA